MVGLGLVLQYSVGMLFSISGKRADSWWSFSWVRAGKRDKKVGLKQSFHLNIPDVGYMGSGPTMANSCGQEMTWE